MKYLMKAYAFSGIIFKHTLAGTDPKGKEVKTKLQALSIISYGEKSSFLTACLPITKASLQCRLRITKLYHAELFLWKEAQNGT